MIVKENVDDKDKLMKELSGKSRLLLEIGPAYQNDINEISYFIRATGLKTVEKKLKFGLPNETTESNCWEYEYFDVIEKKIKQCKIYSPFQHFHGRGFTFIHMSCNTYFVRFKDDHL